MCEGDVSLSAEGGIRVRLDLRLTDDIADTDVLKVYASSPHLPDIYLGMADVKDRECHFKGQTDTKDAHLYDTVKVVKKNAFTDLTAPFINVSFAEDVAGEAKASEQLEYLKHNSAYKDYLAVASTLKSPTLRGAEALDAFRGLHKNIDGEREKCLERIKASLLLARTTDFSVSKGFSWYEVADFALSGVSSATEHILSHPDVSSSLMRYGHFVAGINWDTATLCIAIPVDNPDVNPMPHLSDCTVFIKPPLSDTVYCTVCVMFAPDGQYFAPLGE